MNDRILRDVPVEKARSVVKKAEIARILEKCGSIRTPGVGQRVGVVDARTFFRWHQENPGFWDHKQSRDRFLADNPQYCAQGYKPKPTPRVFDMGKTASA